MSKNFTAHAAIRKQQRGIPQIVADWLLDYGDEQFDGRGGVIRYFSRQCIRLLEREVGRESVARLSEYLRCYLIQSNRDGAIITISKRHIKKHIWRH